MNIVIKGIFYGISKKPTFISPKDGKEYNGVPTIQILTYSDVGYIGKFYELVNITYGGYGSGSQVSDSRVSDFYQKFNSFVGQLCELDVQDYVKPGTDKRYFSTSSEPVFLKENSNLKENSKKGKEDSDSPVSTLSQRISAAA